MPGKTLKRREFLALAGIAGAAVACPALALSSKKAKSPPLRMTVSAIDLWSGKRGKLLYGLMDNGRIVVLFIPFQPVRGWQRHDELYLMEAVEFEQQVIQTYVNFSPSKRPGAVLFYGPNYEVAIFSIMGRAPVDFANEQVLPCKGPSYDRDGGFSWEKCTRAMREPV